jgi:predicted flap endonuclease-1-like 5' DNA nuclease
MSNDNDGSCAKNCWIKGAIAGLVFAILLYIIPDFSFLKSLFWGIVIGVIVALLLRYFLCGKAEDSSNKNRSHIAGSGAQGGSATTGGASTSTASSGSATAGTSSADATASSEPAQTAAASTTASAAMATPAKAFEMKPSAALSGEAELAERKGSWKYEAPEKAPAKKAPAVKASASKDAAVKAEAAPAKKPAAAKKSAGAKKAPAKKAAAKADAAPAKAATKPKRAPVAADGQPEVLAGPRSGTTADDLKLISGVGPKLEQTLNELGFYHFDQVAGWRKKEVEWVDSRLRFKGRIERDDWISQAKILAKGGETEFSARKKK